MEIVQNRLKNQLLNGTKSRDAKAIVAHLGAMQAQDYAMCKWAVGARLPGSTDESIEKALSKGEIIRTHVLRPTWHLVSADDIRWMLELSAPHIRKATAFNDRQFGITETILKKSQKLIAKALLEKELSRNELKETLAKNGIPVDEYRSIHIFLHAELNGLICNGPMQGKQFTYALLDNRVPAAPALSKEEALAKLAKRYFTSHGPASIQDFTWWSGLPPADARLALESVKTSLNSFLRGEITYWFGENVKNKTAAPDTVHLLPAFDEFMVSYKDRSASLDPVNFKMAMTGNGIFKPIIVQNGRTIGTWKRTIKKDTVLIEPLFFSRKEKLSSQMINLASESFGKFLNLKPVVRP